jgi:hypothetical protein
LKTDSKLKKAEQKDLKSRIKKEEKSKVKIAEKIKSKKLDKNSKHSQSFDIAKNHSAAPKKEVKSDQKTTKMI